MRRESLQATFALSCLVAVLVLSFGCGGVTSTNPACSGCQFLYASTNSGQLLTFPVMQMGGLGTPTSTPGPANSTGLIALTTSGTSLQFFLYVSDPQNNAIRVYKISWADGSLSAASVGPYSLGNGSGTPGEMAVFGTTLYVAGSAGSISAFSVNTDGSLTTLAGSPFAAGAGLSHLIVAPSFGTLDTTFLYAANTADANGGISAFLIGAGGTLTPVPGSPFPTVPGGGPEGFYGGGKTLYVALKGVNAVAAFTIANNGSLSPVAGSPFPAGHGASSLTGADGFLFATNNTDGTTSSYSIDVSSGILTQVVGSPFPGAIASGDTLYSNGVLFVPDASSNSVVGLQPNLSTGAVNLLTGSPYSAGTGPLALTLIGFPVIDPP
jgi:6-phosphogluconolactonase